MHESAEIVDAAQTAPLFQQTDEIEKRRGSEAVIEDLQKNAAQRRVHVDQGRCRSCRDGEETKQAITEVIDRQVSDHSFEVALGPRRERREDDRANHEREQPWPGDFDFVREKRHEQPNESVDAHLRKRAGQHHRHTSRRRLIGIGQPGVKWKEWDFDSEPEENSGKGEPLKFAREQSGFSETGERREIECSFGKINSEKGKKHGDAAEKCVDEKFNRRVIAIFAAVNFDEKKCRDQGHLVKQKPENEILGGERAVERRLRHEHERAGAAFEALRGKGERKHERRQQNEKQTQAIDADQIFGADRRNPDVTFDQLQARRGDVEFLPEHHRVERGERIKDERNGARVLWLPDVKRDRTGQGNQNDDAD